MSPSVGAGDVGQQFEQRALAGAVGADDAHSLPFVDIKAQAIERHEGGADEPLVGANEGVGILLATFAGPPALQIAAQRTAADLAQSVLFLHVADANHDIFILFHDTRLLTRYPRKSSQLC